MLQVLDCSNAMATWGGLQNGAGSYHDLICTDADLVKVTSNLFQRPSSTTPVLFSDACLVREVICILTALKQDLMSLMKWYRQCKCWAAQWRTAG